MSWGEIKLFLLIFCENETILYRRWFLISELDMRRMIIFSPVTGMACFIWEFFQPACRDLGIARRDLAKRASPPSHINSMSFFTKNVWRAKISVKRASPLTGLARLHINRPLDSLITETENKTNLIQHSTCLTEGRIIFLDNLCH